MLRHEKLSGKTIDEVEKILGKHTEETKTKGVIPGDYFGIGSRQYIFKGKVITVFFDYKGIFSGLSERIMVNSVVSAQNDGPHSDLSKQEKVVGDLPRQYF